jgi:hypothetical protein
VTFNKVCRIADGRLSNADIGLRSVYAGKPESHQIQVVDPFFEPHLYNNYYHTASHQKYSLNLLTKLQEKTFETERVLFQYEHNYWKLPVGMDDTRD